MARWQSGYAAVCKTVDAGSIPTLASNYLFVSPGGGIGRRYGLKIRCPKGRAGSIPAPGTIFLTSIKPYQDSKYYSDQ